MSGNDPSVRPRATDEAPERASEERAPLFGRWSVWYGLVAIELGLMIALCGWITHRHP